MNQEHVSQIALYFRDLQHEMVIQADVQRALTEALQQLTSEFNQFRHCLLYTTDDADE